MSVTKEEALSPDEMRKRLYQTFKNRGVLDNLKTQLRNQLIQELKHPVLSGEAVPRPVPVNADSVLVTASNSLVIDHLRNSGYEYTLSVFYPECGMSKEKVFSTRDLLQLMKISPCSPPYTFLASNIQKGQKGFLMNLLIELTDHHMHRERCDVDTQTTTSPAYRESLVEKMQMIDEEYEALRYKGKQWASFEAKLAEYRKEIEEQAQAEINAKLQHFKDVEIAKVKMEEKEKSRKEILELRRDMERTYEMKSEALINREKNAIDRLQKQQEIEEKDIYMQRQALLKEIEAVRNREIEMRQRTEAFDKTCKLQEGKTKTTDDLLRRRELAVKTMEDTYDQKLKNEITRYQLELKEEYVKRTEHLTENEKRNEVETVRLQKELAVIDAKSEEHGKACAELRRLHMELDIAQSQAALRAQQNELLRERLETVSDYPTLSREKLELQAQVRLLKNQLEEAHQQNHHLRQDLSQPSKEQLALQTELKRLEMARRLDEEEFENQKQVLHAQLQHEVERCAQLKSQLLEYEERTQWMNVHAEEIKMQLRQTQQALENEVLRNPKPSLVDRSVLDLSVDKMVPPDVYVDDAVLRGRAGYDGVCDSGAASRGRRHHWSRSASPDADTELVSGAMARIRELEKEAETLEEAYRSYQQRAVQAATASLLPPRPHSPQQPPAVRYTKPPLATQARVTFALEEPQLPFANPASDQILQPFDFNRAQSPGERTPPQLRSSPPPRRLSSTPLSISKRQPKREIVEESSPVTFADLSPERQLSPIPGGVVASSGDFTSDLSPPSSPQLRSTARDHSSPPIPSSSQESSPQPEKITIQDLTEPLSALSPEPSHIPEPLQDGGIRPSEEAAAGRTVTHPGGQQNVPQSHEEPAGQEEDEEELQWELERKKREERRQQERHEAQEREQRELERLEQERLLEEAQYEKREKEEKEEKEESVGEEVRGVSQEEQVEESQQPAEEVPASGTDPLQRYMMMVMQGGESQREQSPKKEEPENRSLEAVVSDEKNDSIAAFSHDEEDDEEFW